MRATRMSRGYAVNLTAISASALSHSEPASSPSHPTGSNHHASIWRLVVSKQLFAGLLFALLAILPAANAQSVTGQMSGTVTDSTGAVVAGASVKLTHDLSQQAHTFTTDSSGAFTFIGLVPGAYSLSISQPGFKTYDQKSIIVAAQERVDLHEIKLSVGDVSTSIAVEASVVH